MEGRGWVEELVWRMGEGTAVLSSTAVARALALAAFLFFKRCPLESFLAIPRPEISKKC